MIRSKRLLRFLFASLALLLAATAGSVGYWWHYKFAPMRHLSDPAWLAEHSETARWEEEQRDYQRAGSAPDLYERGDRIGYYGHKDWFLWLDAQVRNPKFPRCGCINYALALMANHYPNSWQEWTDANRAHSQEEWIRDGFLECGVTVHLPPVPEDTLPLLRLLSRKSGNVLLGGRQGTQALESVPSYIHYNAYRWLRDSGFDAAKFAAANPDAAAELTSGLVRFSQWKAAWPGRDGLGVLAFARVPATDANFSLRPSIVQPRLAFYADAVIVACSLGAGWLVWHLLKRRRTE